MRSTRGRGRAAAEHQLGVAAGPTFNRPLIKDLAQSSSSLGRPPEYGVRLAAAFQNAYGR